MVLGFDLARDNGYLRAGTGSELEFFTNGNTGSLWALRLFEDNSAEFKHKVIQEPKALNLLGAPVSGASAMVSDASVYGNRGDIVVGGGATVAPVWADGSNWRFS